MYSILSFLSYKFSLDFSEQWRTDGLSDGYVDVWDGTTQDLFQHAFKMTSAKKSSLPKYMDISLQNSAISTNLYNCAICEIDLLRIL